MSRLVRNLIFLILPVCAYSAAHAASARDPATTTPTVAASQVCGGGSAASFWSAAPESTPALTIVCGNCSDGTCPGRDITSACTDNFGTPGHCGAEPGLPRCSDGHFYCLCEFEPQPEAAGMPHPDSSPPPPAHP